MSGSMQQRGGSVAVRLVVVLTTSMVVGWLLAGGGHPWRDVSADRAVARAAAAITPTALTAARRDESPSLKSLAIHARRSGPRSDTPRAARASTDPLGTLGLGEGTLFAGAGSQTAPNR